jgi:hypothetical protein
LTNLKILLNLLTRFIWFSLRGFKLSTLGSASSNNAFYHKAINYLGKGKGWTYTQDSRKLGLLGLPVIDKMRLNR